MPLALLSGGRDGGHNAANAAGQSLAGCLNTCMPAAVAAAAGWDEILEGGLAEGATVMSWRVGHSVCVGGGEV